MGKDDRHKGVKLKHIERTGAPCLAICTGKHCARGGTKQIIRAARQALQHHEIEDQVSVCLTDCQDYCDYAPVLTILPGEITYQELSARAVEQIVAEHLLAGRIVPEFLDKHTRKRLARRGLLPEPIDR